MNAIKDTIFSLTIRRPFWVILVVTMVVALATYGASKLSFKSDYQVFFSEENPQLIAFEKIQATFNKNDSVAFIVVPKDGVVFSEKTLTAIHALTEASWQIPYSSRVDSVTNYQHTTANGDDLVVESLVLEPELLPELDLERLKSIALDEPVLYKKLISEDASVAIVNTTVQLPGIAPDSELPEVVTKAREIKASMLKSHPDVDIYLSGILMLDHSFSEASFKDGVTLTPLMFGIIALVMIFLLRTISGSLATMVIVIFSITSALGLTGWMGFYLTGPSASAPTMIMTLAVADCIHILTTMLYEMRHGADKRSAILESLRINFQPILLTSLTTAIGFLSMNFSDSPPFRDLGNFVAIGVICAFLFAMTLFPALLSVLPIRVRAEAESNSSVMSRFGEFVIDKRRVLLPSMTAIVFLLVLFLPKNELNDDFVEYFDTSLPFRQATDFMEERVSGLTTQEIEFSSKEPGGINSLEYLKVLAEFSDWMRAQPEVDNVNILSDVLRRLNKNMHGDDAEYYRLPESRQLSAQYLLLYELSLPYGLDLNNQIDVDKSSTRIVVTTQNVTSQKNIEIEQRINNWFAENAPNYSAVMASPSLMFAHIGQRNIQSMLLGTSLALVLISLLLGIALKSVKFGLISLIPNLVPAAMGFGLWYFIDGQVGLGLSVVAGMTLGIVVDDTVHFLSKYIRARRVKNKGCIEAVRYAFASVGQALWITTLVLCAGFMVLAQSTFQLNGDMGLLTALTILIALAVDFLLLPPLLMLLDKDSNKKNSTETTEEVRYVTD